MSQRAVRRRLGALSGAAALAATLVWSGPAAADVTFVQASDALTDLAPGVPNVTDGASADVYAIGTDDRTTLILVVSGLDEGAVGETFGAHVHTGACVPGNGAAAGPHYNIGGTPSPETEVWLDFTVLPGGYAFSQTTVPFAIPAGAAHSVVIHAEPTQLDGGSPGAAGARMACLPVDF